MVHNRHESYPRQKPSLRHALTHRLFRGISLSTRANESESSDEVRGPLGLNLLHEPSEPLIDFIFVHGLRGGSRKTWSKSADPAHFWPKQWLPAEPKLKNVRISSYGYNSDWGGKHGSAATVHDFGQALLGDIHNTLYFSKDAPKTLLVLIGHSMGGVVIKKVVLLARQDPLYHHVAARIHSLFFLATPHRGADSAQLLRKMLKIAVPIGSKAYVDSLLPNSDSNQVINDAFRHAYSGIQLRTFFETVPTSFGLIVIKDSAILNLPGESVHLLNADHRNICKFDDPSDSNYCILRKAFISTVDSIESKWYTNKRVDYQQEMRLLSIYLGTSHSPEHGLANVLDSQMEGSGHWLLRNPNFLSWRSGLEAQRRLFWLTGDPATGKSTLAGHVARCLEQMNGACTSFFFRNHTAGRSTISDLLCSLAWQMASLNAEIRCGLLSMMDEDVAIDKNDERSLWRSLFLSRIFRVQLRQPLFWVIDSIDESTHSNSFFPLLAKIPAQYCLQVFVTSRPSLVLERVITYERIPLYTELITHSRSCEDIALYLKAHSHLFVCESVRARERLVERILEKSNGNFLWTTLVVRELVGSMSGRAQEILESVPEEINDLYARIFQKLMVSPKETKIVATILRWISCVSRPLTVEELREALRLEVGVVLPQLEKTVSSICGNLVHVDMQMRVCLAHQTVAEYLYQEICPSEIVIDRNEAHMRISRLCLDYMQGDELKVPRHQRGSAHTKQRNRSAFVDYAINHFSYHVARASSSRDSLLMDVYNFCRSTSLVWLELVVTSQDLSSLIITAKSLRLYLERRMKYQAPISQQTSYISNWTNDLVHLVAQYGRAMIASPSMISHLIPPVCPKKSSIYQAFYDPSPLGFRLVGLSQEYWDERLCCLEFSGVRVLSVSSMDHKYALGLSNGFLNIYNESSFQEQLRFDHGEPVRKLAFGSTSLYIASAGRKRISLWNIFTNLQTWTADLEAMPMAVELIENDTVVRAATRANNLRLWTLESGKELGTSQFSDINEDDQSKYHHDHPPICVRFASNLNLLGVAYHRRPISFWDLEESSFVGQYHKSGTVSDPEPLVQDFIFNPNPDVCLGSVAYDADVVIFDHFSQRTIAESTIQACSLAASLDGNVLATGSGDGVIRIFDFKTLKPLYQINSSDHFVHTMSFNSSSSRLLDLRGSRFTVWEPSILAYRCRAQDECSLGTDESLEGPEVVTNAITDENLNITAITASHDPEYLFCGRENGTTAVYSSNTGQEIHSTSGHNPGLEIISLQWVESCNILLTVDISGSYSAQRIVKEGRKFQHSILLQKSGPQVQQVILSPNAHRILVSRADSYELWDIEGALLSKGLYAVQAHRLWAQHPTDSEKTLLMIDQGIKIYEWSNLQQCSEILRMHLYDTSTTTPPFLRAEATASGQSLGIYQAADTWRGLAPSMKLFPTQSITSGADIVEPVASLEDIAKDIKHVLGTHKSLLIFLSQQGWLCSINIDETSPENSYTRHFFIPLQWHSITDHLAMCVTKKGCIVLAVRSEVAVFHNGLTFGERVGCKGTMVSTRALMRPVMKRETSGPAQSSAPVFVEVD